MRSFTNNSEFDRHTSSSLLAAKHALKASITSWIALETEVPPSVPNFARTRLKVATGAGARSSDRNVHGDIIVTSLKVQTFPGDARSIRSSALRVCEMCPPLRRYKYQTRSPLATISRHAANDYPLNATPFCRSDSPSPYLGAPVLPHPTCPLPSPLSHAHAIHAHPLWLHLCSYPHT